jgi:hypothetical protein
LFHDPLFFAQTYREHPSFGRWGLQGDYETGYDIYDEEFVNQHINCLGNYLLLSKSHNCSVGNKPFADKRASYTHLEQQREIQEMTKENQTWTRDLIQKRKEKILQYLMTKV